MIFILLTFLTAFLTWYFWAVGRRPKNFPPGPPGIPIFGNALQLGKYNYKTVLAFREKYGDIIGLRMGTHWTVYLNNPDDIREAFSKPEFSGRTGFHMLMDTTVEELNSGLAFSHGERYEHDDPQMQDLMQILDEFFDSIMKGIRPFYFIFPGLLRFKKILSFVSGDTSDKFRKRLFEFFGKVIEEHRRTMQVGQPRDFIDALLEESGKLRDFQEIDLYTTLMDLFIGGTETTSTTLVWSFFFLAQHPETQEKLANEILTVVGNRDVMLSDKLRLPYVEATILEIMRLSHIAPNAAPHAVTQDLIFKGFYLPKNTVVLPNFYAGLMSTEIWGDPDNFRPERFLTPDGKSLVRNKAWMPFGVGKRSCLGESLARDEIFLFLTNLVQQVRVSMPDDEPLHSFEGILNGGTLTPEPHRIIFNNRI
ncbi:unnamed protein product [Allacma fusca]|uniref:Cytochrome P450 n=1 Tax=Allacma fusca TaxID=39272 RepID=A0A8J2P967_9HEXA|nr:unnamed protein product [Allacma fusca]